ncbi:MAG: RHS repeat-associated core domain-containing protein, partial [Nitrospira sp.]|nr:RHS repeat-associated core domain-containing protein [Nitrospira sp.]
MTDALGSVRQLTDAQGEITLANAYEPYGDLAQANGTAQTSYGFTSEFTDPSGMVYLRARYYMPSDGRFLTRDTWMGDYNSPLSLNRWMYVEGNPINYTDPSGHDGIPTTGGGIGSCFGIAFIVPDPGLLESLCAIAAAYLLVLPAVLTGDDFTLPEPTDHPYPGYPGVRQVPEIIPLEQILEACWVVIRPKQKTSPTPDPFRVPLPARLPLPTQTPDPKPEYIYRDGPDIPKRVRLYREGDYKTGLSFWDRPPLGTYIKFRVSTLEANGYVVIPDGRDPVVELPFFGGGLYQNVIRPNPDHHVTVYL